MAVNPSSIAASRRMVRPLIAVERLTAILLIAQFVLMLAALFILGAAINWPASLDEPAAVNLPLILEQAGAVTLGYGSYFLSSLLLAPIALLVYALGREGDGHVTLLVAAGLGVLASFAKLLGISRWLLVMPVLAQSYIDPAVSDATRAAITVAYDTLNSYSGGVGELLGVSLLSGLWTLLVSTVLLRGSTLAPRWMGVFGLVAGVLLLGSLPAVVGVDVGPIPLIQGFAWQFWLLALGIFFLRGPRTA